jgi:hypothetical protein
MKPIGSERAGGAREGRGKERLRPPATFRTGKKSREKKDFFPFFLGKRKRGVEVK